jgi:hypothetical protein
MICKPSTRLDCRGGGQKGGKRKKCVLMEFAWWCPDPGTDASALKRIPTHGSFDLLSHIEVAQAADAKADGLQGRGHYLLPPLKGAPSTETTTGRMEFRQVVE